MMNRIGEPPQKHRPRFDLSEKDVEEASDELAAYHKEFADLFRRHESCFRLWSAAAADLPATPARVSASPDSSGFMYIRFL